MTTILEKIKENARQYPERIAYSVEKSGGVLRGQTR